VRETSSDGGIARFAIDFAETEAAPPFPRATPSGVARVDVTGNAIVEALRGRAALRGAVSLPASALASAQAALSDAAGAVQSALAPLVADTQELAALKVGVANLVLDAAVLARAPASALDAFVGVLESVPSLPPALGVVALLAACDFVPSVARPPATTALRVAEQEAYDLTLHLVRTALVVQAARLAAEASFDSYDAAVAARDAVLSALEDRGDEADDDTFAALAQMRADLVRAVPGEDRDLPRLVRYAPPATVPSLVLAHRLYGDVAREADIVTRNRVERPGFIRGGLELQVLSDD
jgi:prophage DNA circulation protein